MTGVLPSTECFLSIVSHRWSSVRMKTMFGREAAATGATIPSTGSSMRSAITVRPLNAPMTTSLVGSGRTLVTLQPALVRMQRGKVTEAIGSPVFPRRIPRFVPSDVASTGAVER